MFRIILAMALLSSDTRLPRADELPPVGPPGFALYCVHYKDGDGPIESRLTAIIYNADHKVIGEFHAGEALPQPFQDWRVVGFPHHGKPSVIVTNLNTKETVELERTAVPIRTGHDKPVKVH